MPAISNLVKAHKKINEEASKVAEGKYTADVAASFLTQAAKEFNLSVEKAEELKAMTYDRPLDGVTEEEAPAKEMTLEEVVQAQSDHIENLTKALAKIGTLTGYGNHLKEFNIDKWIPTRKDMNKKYD